MDTLQVIREQLVRLRGSEASSITGETIISQVVDSRSFLTLLMALEKTMQITVSDEDFYESAPVTLGQLAHFLHSLREQRSERVDAVQS
jgi:acyl carrier protein